MEIPQALDSRFLAYKINEPIPLKKDKGVLHISGKVVEIDTIVKLRWFPRPSIYFKGEIISESENWRECFNDISNRSCKLILSNKFEGEAHLHGITMGKERFIEGTIESLSSPMSAEVNMVDFSVVNFLNASGDVVGTETTRYRGRLSFLYKGWQITIDKRSDFLKGSLKPFTQLKNQGGYLITHVGEIKRSNGETFEPNQINPIINSLRWLLSFAAGRHVGINLLEGKLDGERNWIDYQIPNIAPWKSNLTWFTKQNPGVLSDLFPSIMTQFEDEYFSKIYRESLSWYMECFSNGILENKIVACQTTLEMLSWSYLVIMKKRLSKTKYKKHNASDNIRILLKEFDIEVEYIFISDLKGLNYDDGVHLLTAARNNIVHPEKTDIFTIHQQYMILQIGIRYIELILLKLLNFEGYYLNRLKRPLWEGDYELVPWSKDNKKGS